MFSTHPQPETVLPMQRSLLLLPRVSNCIVVASQKRVFQRQSNPLGCLGCHAETTNSTPSLKTKRKHNGRQTRHRAHIVATTVVLLITPNQIISSRHFPAFSNASTRAASVEHVAVSSRWLFSISCLRTQNPPADAAAKPTAKEDTRVAKSDMSVTSCAGLRFRARWRLVGR